MTVTTGFTKRAWIRDANQPEGGRVGRISCPCGNAPASVFGDGKVVECPCGVIYDSEGWILQIEWREEETA